MPVTKISIDRRFTTAGIDPLSTFTFVRTNARISNPDGTTVSEMLGIEVPAHWDQVAVDVLATKYFRKAGVPQVDDEGEFVLDGEGNPVLGTETSARQWAYRLANAWKLWGERGGYFAGVADAEAFRDEMVYMLVAQMASPNSPQHFNTGLFDAYGITGNADGNWAVDPISEDLVETPDLYSRSAASACYIQSVADQLVGPGSIMDLWEREARLFKSGSGSGTNFSSIRGKGEKLSGGGKSSGLMSFLEVGDRSAGAIQSGGTTRRAAKMVILDADHPDVEEFISWKVREEEKVAALIAMGYSSDWQGEAYRTVSGQNSNNSIRLSKGFMQAMREGRDWHLINRTDGKTSKVIKADELWAQIADAAWRCADPGVQFDDIINEWATAPNDGPIRGSNPCFPGSVRVHTNRGLVQIGDLVQRVTNGETFQVWTHDETSEESPASTVTLSSPANFMVTGMNEIVALTFSNGAKLRCTPGHKIFTTNRGFTEARELTSDDRVKVADLATAAVLAEYDFRLSDNCKVQAGEVVKSRYMAKTVATHLPDKWTPGLAHLLGWLTGDGSISRAANQDTTVWVYGSAVDVTDILPGHLALVSSITGYTPKVSLQRNGTQQLRVSRTPWMNFLRGLGYTDAKATAKRVPEAVFHAPSDIVAGYLRGLFDADGTVISSENKTRYIGLGSSSMELLRDVQTLLIQFGINAKIYGGRKADMGVFKYKTVKGEERSYDSSPGYSLRISGNDIRCYVSEIGFDHSEKAAKAAVLVDGTTEFYNTHTDVALVSCEHDGFEVTYNLTEPTNHSYIVDGIVVRNCSEYMHIDDTACNLASINLGNFYDAATKTFDTVGFRHASRLWAIVLEITVSMSHYPSEAVARNSYEHRTLGLGYANVGALLMRSGIAYDSDAGRAVMSALTALLHFTAYSASAEMAGAVGPCVAYTRNAEEMQRVLHNHLVAAYGGEDENLQYQGLTIKPVGLDHAALADTTFSDLSGAVLEEANRCVALGLENGYRNMQSTVIAPTGTIGLQMSCDTTGVEPDFALVKFKKLAGGGYMKLVNSSVEMALRALGYDNATQRRIIEHALGTQSLDGNTAVNRASLLEAGLASTTVDAIEVGIPTSMDLEFAATQAVTQQIGSDPALEGLDPSARRFSLLTILGFTPDEIRESSLVTCGHQTVEGAPDLRPEHLSVFDCANYCGDGTRTIHWTGHVRALGAVAPFISGSVSKTINLPNEATREDVMRAYELSYELGVKACAVYRDGSKLAQVLSSTSAEEDEVNAVAETTIAEHIEFARRELLEPMAGVSPSAHYAGVSPVRFRLPTMVYGPRWKFSIGGTEVFLRTSEYADGTCGEIWIDLSKEGSTLKGILACFAISVSTGLQYGVPLSKFVDMFVFHSFEPRGPVSGHANLKMANSIVDAVFRILGHHYLGREDLVQVHGASPKLTLIVGDDIVTTGQVSVMPREPAVFDRRTAVRSGSAAASTHVALASPYTGEMCTSCNGFRMVKSGTCSTCQDCSATSGCS
jgi:ribonucleoside-diphosphate reductase alpha chain